MDDKSSNFGNSPAIYLLCLWWISICVTFLPFLNNPYEDWKNILLYSGALVLLISQLKKTVLSPPKKPAWPYYLYFLIGYFLSCLFSVIASHNSPYPGALQLAENLLWASLVWSFSKLSCTQLKLLVKTSVVLTSVVVIFNWVNLDAILFNNQLGNILSPGEMSPYADFMASNLLLAAFLFINENRKKFYAVCIFLLSSGVWFGSSRGTILSLLVCQLLFTFLLSYFTRFDRLKIWTIPLIIGLTFVMQATLKQPVVSSGWKNIHRTSQLFEADNKETWNQATSSRWAIWQTSIKMIGEKPIMGWGLGSFAYEYPPYAASHHNDKTLLEGQLCSHPHNELLHQLMELGIFGGLLFILFWLCFYHSAISQIRTRSKSDPELSLKLVSLAGLTMNLMSMQLNTNWEAPLSRLIVALFASILLKKFTHNESHQL